MMRFANPAAFQLLWFLPIIWVLMVVFEKRGRAAITKAFGENISPVLTASLSVKRRRLKTSLRMLALAFFILALARPQMGQSTQEVKATGVEIMIAFDVSNSMLAEDMKPSRLQYAKTEISRLLDLLAGDKVGLVAFAGSATLVSPLTNDKTALKMFIDSLTVESVQTQGTNVKKALNEAKKAFDRGGLESDESLRVTRVILVVSDGEDQEQGALDEAKTLATDGTRIFALAFGTERGGPIPLRDERGFLRGYKKDKNGQNVISAVKGDFLRELAAAGQGSFYHAVFGGQEAKRVKEDLDKLEKAEFNSSLATSYDERFQIPLLIGIILALIELLVGERNREAGRLWRGRFEVSAMLALSLLGSGPADANELKGYWKNNQGVRRFGEKKPVEAFDKFTEALTEMPFSGRVHYNLGTSFLAHRQYEKALSEYQAAIKSSNTNASADRETRFRAHFNSGVALTEMKKIDEALASYQAALEENPGSVETKTNIELLTKMGGGGGEGDDSNQKSNGDDKDSGNQQGQNPKDQKNAQKPRPTPRQFKSEDLSQQDVSKILEELKRQEEQIRARMSNEGAKDAPADKDW